MNEMLKYSGKKVIITGASSGIGKALAFELAKYGATPILIARSLDKLKQTQTEIKQTFNQESVIMCQDLSETGELETLFNSITEKVGVVDALINNAGCGYFKNVSDLSYEETKTMLELNVHVLMQLSQLFVQADHKTEQARHILQVASFASQIATPKAAVYAGTKHAVLGYSNGLRLELKGTNTYVTVVNTGPVQTDFFHTADPTGNYEASIAKVALKPDFVARKIVDQLFKNKREINLPWWMTILSKVYGLFPKGIEKVFYKQFAKK